MLIDEIEKDLHGLQSYQETHSYISDAIPELKPFLESKVVPVTGDWPTWYFHKKMVCQSNPESLTLVPELGQFHIYLDGIEDVIKQYHPIFNEIYKAVFGQKKSLPENPKPDKITLSSTIAFTGWLHVRSHIIKAFGGCKDVEYASIHHLFDELLPLNFLHYPVIVRSGNFSNIQDSMKRLCLMFITMDRHHYNKATLSWISDTQHQKDICPEYYQAKQDLCSVLTEKKVEIFHSKIRSCISKTDKGQKIQETARLLARSNFGSNMFEQDYVNRYQHGVSDQNLLHLSGNVLMHINNS